jgi:hypothetical protein
MLEILRPFLIIFVMLAAIGLVLSLMSHVAALAGMSGPLGDYSWLLHIGIFMVFLPTILVASALTKGADKKDYWKVALRNCPPWMRLMVYAFFIYAFVNFFYFMLTAPKHPGAGPMPPAVVRGFSGHWMAFYSFAMGVLYSAMKSYPKKRCCLNGHNSFAEGEFCEKCGQAFWK